jgi:hypothetical protein
MDDEIANMKRILINKMKDTSDVSLIDEINALSDDKFLTNYRALNKRVEDSNIAYNTTLKNEEKKKTASGGRHREMNLKDIKELCKANQIKLSRVVDGKRVAYKKKELMTKLKRKKLL